MNPKENGRQSAHDGAAPADEQTPGTFEAVNFDHGLEWRLIGPFRGGRSVAVAGDPSNPNVYYFGSTGGGVWKTTDGGRYWRNVSDGFFKRASVGSVAVSLSDPNVIYAGMGEATIRGNVSHGDGVYKSTDAGNTWQHLGLAETRNIGKVRVHPENPEIVYVAALGHAHGPNKERGVYRSKDGGKTWEHVLYRGEDAGSNDLCIDATNPRRIFATFWRARRYPHQLVSGGEGCAIFRSDDGGDTWTELTHNHGLPKGTLGKIGIAASPARAGRVWAIIESEEGVIYRSDDAGETWERVCDEHAIRQRPWYYQHIVADPSDADTVWVLNVKLWRSTDGGRTFSRMPIPHGDNHDLWIDPHNSKRMIESNDGGATITVNGGDTWSSIYNQPTCEFYHVTTDEAIPYRVYGAQQDNSTISVPSRSDYGAIADADYLEIGGGESGYIAVRQDPTGDGRTIFAGSYQGYVSRYDRRTQQRLDISVWPEPMMGWPAKECRYRFQWTFPIMISPHDPNTVYVAGNHVFRSTNDGHSWDEISPDLTRNDISRLGDTGGPLTNDNCGTEYYGTVFALAVSPKQPGVLWAGSDDGLVHVTRDGGQNWQNVTPKGLPEWALISIIEASPHDPAVAYVAANRYKHDDFAPYLFKTDDYGAHWTQITNGLPANSFARTIREDPERRGMLFAGTETGIYVSFDDGQQWRTLKQNLPVVPVHDLVIKGSDVVAATHGRSFWILDDITPLRQLHEGLMQQPAQLFNPRPAIRWGGTGGWGSSAVPGLTNYQRTSAGEVAFVEVPQADGEKKKIYLDAGANPHDGVYINYLLKEKPEGEVTLTFYDANGQEIRRYSSEERKRRIAIAEDLGATTAEHKREKPEEKVPVEAGINRFYWDMHYPPARPVEGYVNYSGEVAGPQAVPGHYTVRLAFGGFSQTAEFEILKDPRIEVSQADLEAQFHLQMQIRDKITQTHEAIDTIQGIREQVEEWEHRMKSGTKGSQQEDQARRAGDAVLQALKPIEAELIDRRIKENDDTLRFPIRLNIKLAELYDSVGSADAAPTTQAQAVFQSLAQRVDAQLARLHEVVDREVADFNRVVRESGVAAVVPSGELHVKEEERKPAMAGVPGEEANKPSED